MQAPGAFIANIGRARLRLDDPDLTEAKFVALVDVVRRFYGTRTLDIGSTAPADLGTITRKVFGCRPDEWDGEYHLHLGGKTGETLFAAATIGAIKRLCPRVQIVLHVHPRFAGVAAGSNPRADRVVTDEWFTAEDGSVADQVSAGLRHAMSWIGAGENKAFRVDGTRLHVGLYRMWRGRGPFYRLFADAAGVGGYILEPPKWRVRPDKWHRLALAFPSGNHHMRRGRQLALGPAQWRRLANGARAAGLSPTANVAPSDRVVDMPGWAYTSVDFSPEHVLDILARGGRVLGLNSGIVFAAMLLSPGRVTMIDSQERACWKLGPMQRDGFIDRRHVQVPWAEWRARPYQVAKAALA